MVASAFLVMEPRTQWRQYKMPITASSISTNLFYRGNIVKEEKAKNSDSRSISGLADKREGRGGGDRYRSWRDDYGPHRSRRDYRGGGRERSPPPYSGWERDYSPLPMPPPRRSPSYSGKPRRERTRSPPPARDSPYGIPDQGYSRGAR